MYTRKQSNVSTYENESVYTNTSTPYRSRDNSFISRADFKGGRASLPTSVSGREGEPNVGNRSTFYRNLKSIEEKKTIKPSSNMGREVEKPMNSKLAGSG